MLDTKSKTKNEKPKAKSEIENQKSKIRRQLSEIRILLWDIDGTLLSSTRHGAFKEYFAPAMEKIYGSAGKLLEMKVSGMTDSQIAYEALKDEGFSPQQIFGKIKEFTAAVKKGMARFVREREEPYRLLPGVKEILTATANNPRFISALLTGNFRVGAEIKLKYFDLWKYFKDKPNTFGEVSHDRRQLAKAAGENIEKFLRVELNHKQFIVIGDTPNDIACARALGAKMVSVATSKIHPKEELAKYKPDVLLDDLSDTKEVLRVLESL